ncbi:MAG: aldehyde dehydrogenase family protein [Spirochaetaceae bacterium]|nr:MAG: aldehyde dehydrogenase family protein [Spirochaetaceae bacterium]
MSDHNERPMIVNPATGAAVAEIAEHTAEQVAEAAERARDAQREWSATSVSHRARIIRRARRFVADNADRLAAIVSECTGKPRIDALATEVLPAAVMVDYYARIAPRVLRPHRIAGSSLLFFDKASTLHREPFGVVGIISPWNYPLGIPLHEVITALLCGNAVLLKVATQVQPVGDAIAAMFAACGLPAGLLHVVHVPGRIAGEALLDAGIAKLFFTGSTDVGRELARKAGERLVPVSLELGGNDAMLVLPGADLLRAAACAVWAGMSNTGQSCGGVERIYVAESVYDAFVAALRPMVERLRVGADVDHRVDVGSLTTRGQLDTVTAHVRDARQRGAIEVAASSLPAGASGHFHPALVLELSDDDASLLCDETFGPVIALRRVRDVDEAVSRANASQFGLTASVWTQDRRLADAVASRLEAGAVTINDHLMSHGMPETPWGGVKESGIGRSHSELGFHEMTQPKVVVRGRFGFIRKNMWWQPYSPEVYRGLSGALTAFYGHGIGSRVRGIAATARLFIRRARGID